MMNPEIEVRGLKINEVEALVGITRKNIRFYEAEGLLTPRRNSENGYRDYGEAEVRVLLQIKLMRKLGVSLEEIRRMQGGVHTPPPGHPGTGPEQPGASHSALRGADGPAGTAERSGRRQYFKGDGSHGAKRRYLPE